MLSDGKVSWLISYDRFLNENGTQTFGPGTTVDQYKIRAKVEVRKDDVQAVVPLAKVWKIENFQ